MMATHNAPPMSRAAKAIMDDSHGLADYSPQVGDILVVFHDFREVDKDGKPIIPSDPRERKKTEPKFRPCLVAAVSGNNVAVVPVSSSPHRDGHHLAISERSELESFGLNPDKPSYVKVLEARVYDLPHPLIKPTLDQEGNPSWTAGSVPKYLVSQVRNEFARQKKHGRFDKPRKSLAKDVPQELIEHMQETARMAKLMHELNTPRAEASRVETREDRVLSRASERFVREEGDPDRIKACRERAEGLARKRGVDPESRAARREERRDKAGNTSKDD